MELKHIENINLDENERYDMVFVKNDHINGVMVVGKVRPINRETLIVPNLNPHGVNYILQENGMSVKEVEVEGEMMICIYKGEVTVGFVQETDFPDIVPQ